MERPERPTRHKSHPVKWPKPIQPSFSSDSESEVNENDVSLQISYHQIPESADTGGPSTSSLTGQTQSNQTNTEVPVCNILSVSISPEPLAVTLPPLSFREEETRPEQPSESVRRKRSAATSAAASVIFESVETLFGPTNSSRDNELPQRSREPRLTYSDYVIRPRRFCKIGYTSPPPFHKLKRPNLPIDLTPSTATRDPSCSAPIVTSSFSLCDNQTTSADNTPNLFYDRTPTGLGPFILPSRSDSQSASSSILRQFDEMCSSSPVIRRRTRPSIVRDSTFDEYSDLVANLFCQAASNISDSQRSTSTLGSERAGLPEPQTSSSGSRHIIPPDIINHDLLAPLIPFLDPLVTPSRSDLEAGGETMEQSNDDVIVVETPERLPLPSSPDTFMVPSSRSPSPLLPSAPATVPCPILKKRILPHPRPNRSTEVPMTLQELNQTLVSLLECPVCLDHATPPIYQCGKGHLLCHNCHPRLTTCPMCRCRLPGDRNSAMEKVAEKLMYPCKNTVTGCSMMLKLDDKQEHEEACGFRHYACIVTPCHWKGYKPELVVHLRSTHPEKLISGACEEVHVPVPTSVTATGSMLVIHNWIQSAHNEVFNVIFNVDLYKKVIKGCVIYIGSPDKAENFSYAFELKQKVPPYRKLSYSRTTHADTLKPGQPLCLPNDFSINIDAARLYRPEDCAPQTVPIYVSIMQDQ